MTAPLVGERPLQTLIDAEALASRAAALGAEITADYGDRVPLLLVVMHGALVFAADLMRNIHSHVELCSVSVSSYPNGTEPSHEPRMQHALEVDVRDRDVIIVEDIVDTGFTLSLLLDQLRSGSPASIAVATCLDKPARRQANVPLRYVGFQIPPVFVVGYGLDLDGRYRNLPYVAHLSSDE